MTIWRNLSNAFSRFSRAARGVLRNRRWITPGRQKFSEELQNKNSGGS
jgi:hypothetical protein